MATYYSDYSKGWKPSSVTKHYRAKLVYTSTYDDLNYYVTTSLFVNIDSSVNASYSGKILVRELSYGDSEGYDDENYEYIDISVRSGSCKTVFEKDKTVTCIKESTVTIPRRTYNFEVKVDGYIASSNGSWTGQKMYAKDVPLLTVQHLHYFLMKFDANGGSGTIADRKKFYNIAQSCPNGVVLTKSGFKWRRWNLAADDSDQFFSTGSLFKENRGREDIGLDTEHTTLYAIWTADNPPECDNDGIHDYSGFSSYTKNFSLIGTELDLDTLVVHEGRTFVSATLYVGTQTVTKTAASLELDSTISLKPSSSGTQDVVLELEDSLGAINSYVLGTIDVENPTWNITATFSKEDYLLPITDANGRAIITVEAEVYNNGWTNTYEEIQGTYPLIDNEDDWSIVVTLGEGHVDDNEEAEPEAHIRVSYTHTEYEETDYRKAFFSTTRNANFSNGIYNTEFVSGCSYPNYSSRVWWCAVNNPLYFPDTNYVEVGSNDTSVMGLTKVGDYLGAIKQSKTTDTAIYLLYPTSFDEDTTYAVKQGVQGVGAIGKYTFNILGDETLFLSPKGVMAIAPYGNDDHKVLNRSYFIDGQLLNEPNIKDAYSFVYGGMYYLAIDENVYVLDGNQRNSWGNDKTNLVYECYYLTNVPADCFVKYNDSLMFSNSYGLCRFKDESVSNTYTDAYNHDENDVPVKARWSTVFDDDNALNYYKTMKKKGNLVSVFPSGEFRYKIAVITEEQFNKKKTDYFTLVDNDFVRCTKEDVYNSATTYYVRVKTSTKVFVRKDLNDPVEIERQFGESSEIPSELFVNKKFKKYKRLQFILENNADEPFGVDSIIKQYTIGNYAKK